MINWFIYHVIADMCIRKTLIIDGENDHPLFCLLDHLLAFAFDDEIFETESALYIENIFRIKIPPGKCSLALKWKREVLDLSVLRELMRDAKGFGTSTTKLLLASTFARNLRRLGRIVGLRGNLGQKYFRRGLLNVVNSKIFWPWIEILLIFCEKC